MVGTSLIDFVRADAFDQNFAFVRSAVAIGISENRKKWRMQNPHGAVVINQSARMIHLCKVVELVCLAVSISVDATHNFSSTRFLAQ